MWNLARRSAREVWLVALLLVSPRAYIRQRTRWGWPRESSDREWRRYERWFAEAEAQAEAHAEAQAHAEREDDDATTR